MSEDTEGFEWKDPHWVAIASGYRSRPVDEVKAILFLTRCYKRRDKISLVSFAARYSWSRNKARRVLRQAGVEIFYPEGKSGPVCGCLVLLSKNKLNPKTAHLRIVTHGQCYFRSNL